MYFSFAGAQWSKGVVVCSAAQLALQRVIERQTPLPAHISSAEIQAPVLLVAFLMSNAAAVQWWAWSGLALIYTHFTLLGV